jgi:TonB family protein
MRARELKNIYYDKYLQLKPGFSGKVTLKFTIAPSGDIVSISIVSSTTGYTDFDAAVKNMVATWKWKLIKSGNTTPTIPFNFNEPEGSTQTQAAQPVQPAQSVQPTTSFKFRDINGSMLDKAVVAAENIKKWWNINFISQKSKYPMPDDRIFDIGSAKSDFVKDNDYLSKLTGKTEEDYQMYLKLRNDYANLPTFYFDMADWFYKRNNKEIALRILTSIADLELENASLYRLLGYRFKEYGEYALEKFVCQKVVQWRPMEPQSYRDYALALADNGEEQAALDSLYGLLTKQYSENINRRSRGIEEVVVMEINRLIAKNTKLNTSKIDKRLITNVPIDVRVVINWNMNNTDIDLHVKDPNDEECYYSHRETSIGGHISADNTGGYGPEQFLLKKAIKGKYRIYVNYYSDRQFTAAGPSTIMAEIFTKYADKTEQRQVVSLQMSNAKRKDGSKKVEVAEFEF